MWRNVKVAPIRARPGRRGSKLHVYLVFGVCDLMFIFGAHVG
jgi:hypothetical protein